MDDIIETSDNDDVVLIDDYPCIDIPPIPDNCNNEIDGIESLHICFTDRYNTCPAFFMGTLQDACKKAFQCDDNSPVLVYIHHDKNILSNIFCLNIFCSDTIINYLLDKYIVWPWDITYESNRNRLIKSWNEIFPNQVSLDFSKEQCPMLIGIRRQSKYEFIPLLKDDVLIHTSKKFNVESILNELILFKEEFDEIEQALTSEFMIRTGFNSEIIVEICQYLDLNDIINTFSNKILYLLRHSKINAHMTNPDEKLLCLINKKIQSEQIISLKRTPNDHDLSMIVNFIPMFNHIISLTLENLHLLEELSEYEIYFPSLTCLLLRYTDEIGLSMLENIFQYLPSTIQKLKIYSSGLLCTHYDNDYIRFIYNFKITYFLLDMTSHHLNSINECFGRHKSCLLMMILNFMKYMANLKYFHMIINSYHIEKFLDINQWKSMFSYWLKLKTITIYIVGNGELLAEKIEKFRQEFTRIHLRVVFKNNSNI